MINHVHRVKRGVSHNNTSPNVTKAQNTTTTGVPSVATTSRRRTGWSTRRRNIPRPTGQPTWNLTGLTDAEKEKIIRRNRSAVPLDHFSFPFIPNSHRGTLRPLPHTQSNASRPTQNLGGNDGNGNLESLAEFRLRENKTQASTLPSNTSTTNSIELSSKVPHTEKAQKKSHRDKRRDISSVISKHGIWIAVVASLLLSTFICLSVHWARQRRRGKLIIAPADNKGQRSAVVVYSA